MYSLLLLSLLHITTCTVYTVTPDDHYYPNTTCHHCHNLQHYLLNITKYFTSNTQLLFLPGLHHLHTDLTIQNVHNISLIGSTANGIKQSTTICINYKLSSVLMINVSNLTIKNMMFTAQNSQGLHDPSEWIPLTIKDCSFVVLNNLPVYKPKKWTPHNFTFIGINIMGNSYFDHIECFDKMHLLYNETQTNKDHHILLMSDCTATKIKLSVVQGSYKVTVKIADTLLRNTEHKPTDDPLIYVDELGFNEVMLINCQFIKNVYTDHLLLFSSSSNGSVKFINCQFINNVNFYTMVYITMHNIMQVSPRRYVKPALIKVHLNVRLEFKNCRFYANSEHEAQIVQAHGSGTNPATVVIKNTTFSYYTTETTNPYQNWFDADMLDLSFIYLSNSILLLETPVVFNNITTPNGIISLKGNSTIIVSGSVEFSHNVGQDLINFYNNSIKYIIMKENSVINITYNDVWLFFATKRTGTRYQYPFCLFQYFSNNSASLVTINKRNFLIRFYNNQCKQAPRLSCYDYMPLTHCLWLP